MKRLIENRRRKRHWRGSRKRSMIRISRRRWWRSKRTAWRRKESRSRCKCKVNSKIWTLMARAITNAWYRWIWMDSLISLNLKTLEKIKTRITMSILMNSNCQAISCNMNRKAVITINHHNHKLISTILNNDNMEQDHTIRTLGTTRQACRRTPQAFTLLCKHHLLLSLLSPNLTKKHQQQQSIQQLKTGLGYMYQYQEASNWMLTIVSLKDLQHQITNTPARQRTP